MEVLITGATGFIGRALVLRLERARVLSRDLERAKRAFPSCCAHAWDAEQGPPPASALEDVDAIVHLAGEPVAEGSWNEEKKRRIRDSRVLGTRNLLTGIAGLAKKPRVLVSGSAVGYYGDRGDEVLCESSPPGEDFLAQVCREWEAEADRAAELGIRVVKLRTGIVLGKGGGALARMLTPFKLCVGGRLGSGRQWMPWIHREDIVGLILHALSRDEVSGPVCGVAPSPVTNRDFTKTLASVLGRPAIFPVPAFALRMAFGEMGSVLLASQRVVPKVAQATGYRFAYPELEGALRSIVGG